MDVKTLQNFIADKVYYDVPAKTVEEMMTDAASMDFGSFVEKWDDTLKAKSEGWSNIRNEAKPLPERITAAFGTSDTKNPFEQDSNYKDELYEKSFKDVPKEQFDKTVVNMSKYWENEKRAREYEADKKQRQKEVKEWGPIKSALASEYAKQRYINEPEKSIFSDKGEWYNKGEDVSDLIYGGTGAVADAIPGYGAFLGPAIRATRDIQHKVTDSPYQKDWSNIGQDALSDAAVNAGVEFLPTALLNRGRKLGKNISKTDELFSDYGAEISVAQRQKANDAALDYLHNNFEMFNDARVAQIRVNSMPESDVKNDIIALVNSDNYSRKQLERYLDAYNKANKNGINAYRYVPKNATTRPNKHMNTSALGNNAVDFFKSKERLQGLPESKLRSGVAKAMTNYMPAGQTFVKEIDTAKGRGSAPEVNEQLAKDWYKQNYDRDWKLGFKPNAKEGDLLWEAYKEWESEQKGN